MLASKCLCGEWIKRVCAGNISKPPLATGNNGRLAEQQYRKQCLRDGMSQVSAAEQKSSGLGTQSRLSAKLHACACKDSLRTSVVVMLVIFFDLSLMRCVFNTGDTVRYGIVLRACGDN